MPEKVSLLHVELNQIIILPLPQGFDFEDFNCGEPDYNDYLRDGTAYRDEAAGVARVYLAMYEDKPIGYFAVLNDAIQLETKERPKTIAYSSVPALKIGRLATSLEVQGQGIGKYLVQVVVGLAIAQSKVVGCRFVTLDALPGREDFYLRQGFVRNKLVHKNFEKLRNKPLENTSMRLDILIEEKS